MIDAEDISTEEFSDVSQDRESELIMRKENEKIEQIQEYKAKLERLETEELDELKKVCSLYLFSLRQKPIQKWKRLESKASQERKTLNIFKAFLLESIKDEYTQELKEGELICILSDCKFPLQLIRNWRVSAMSYAQSCYWNSKIRKRPLKSRRINQT